MKLDNRMYAILSHVEKCRVVADIGADHGYISASVSERGLADKVIASDISEKSVSKARALVKIEKLNNIEIRVGNGTSVLEDDECDTLIIAGMGGSLIANILSNDSRIYNRYILSPQRDQEVLRNYMKNNNLTPIFDYKVESLARYYDVIVAETGEYNPTESELLYGFGKGDGFKGFYTYELSRLIDIISKSSGDKKYNAEYKLLLLKKASIKTIIK